MCFGNYVSSPTWKRFSRNLQAAKKKRSEGRSGKDHKLSAERLVTPTHANKRPERIITTSFHWLAIFSMFGKQIRSFPSHECALFRSLERNNWNKSFRYAILAAVTESRPETSPLGWFRVILSHESPDDSLINVNCTSMRFIKRDLKSEFEL